MPTYTIHLTTPIAPTFRVHQVAGLFDLPLDDLAEERFAHTLTAELPGLDEDWSIGAIVGPSGSGKTTLARAAYGDALYECEPWPEDAAIIDALESRSRRPGGTSVGEATSHGDSKSRPAVGTYPLKDLLRVLTAVGLASPPSWLRPYRVLSTGERFRADLARAILASGVREHADGAASATNPRHREATTAARRCPTSRSPSSLLVFDEFTSNLDRTVACTASFALSKFLRQAERSEVRDQTSGSDRPTTRSSPNLKSEIGAPATVGHLKFIALSCHTDFLPWLAPDWILDLAETRSLTPSGTRGVFGDPSPETSVTRSGRTAAPVPHGVRDLPFRPYWPRGSLHRPSLRLAIRRVPQKLWPHFARHHYLSGGLSTAATCYCAFVENKALTSGQGVERFNTDAQHSPDDAIDFAPNTPSTGRGFELPIAFCAVLATLGWKRTKRITRLVVLPEFQGLGIGPRLAEAVAADEAAKGNRVTITASHPSVLAWCSRSPRWKYLGLKKTGSTRQQLGPRVIRCSTGRAVVSYEFIREGEALREGEAPAEP